jgi:hypothetical protein
MEDSLDKILNIDIEKSEIGKELKQKQKQAIQALIDRECSKAIIKVVSSITTDKGDAYYQNIPLYRYVEQMRAELSNKEN